jgi:hypothetical protein
MSGNNVHSANWRGYRLWAHAIRSQRAAAKKPQLMALPLVPVSGARLKP